MRLILGSSLLVIVAVAVAAPPDAPTPDEERTIAALTQLGGKASIEPLLPAEARVAVKFDTATDATLATLKKHPRIGSVWVIDATKCTDKGFAAFKELPKLRKLVLTQVTVTEKTLALIGDCKQLRTLAIGGPTVADAELVGLKKLTYLESLDLSENRTVTDKGMATIKALERLQFLYLAQTGITDQGLLELKGLEGLRGLNVTGTRVTADAAEKFADAMPNLRQVRR